MVLPIENPTKSYWIEAADSPLKNFRSTDELPTETDVVIIGSGYAGTTTAYWLHKYTENSVSKPRMLLLEARDICGSATGRNGGQLRPHAYSRYTPWAERFGPDGAMALIKHEMAHLPAFEALLKEEGILEDVCFKLGETFDAAMTDEAWIRLKGCYEAMKKDHGENADVVKDCRLIEEAVAAEHFTQMKGCIGAVVHPTGQVWPYKFIHALLRIVLAAGRLNLQAHTPVLEVSDKDTSGWITVKTARGLVRAKKVVHAINRWTSHLLPDFGSLIFPGVNTVAAIKAPEGFIKHTGAQHWDSLVNNYHVQLPPPFNTLIIGGAKPLIVHNPRSWILQDSEDKQLEGVPEFFRTWAPSDIVGWPSKDAELARAADEGGCWTGVDGSSIDGFPYVGAVPKHDSQFIASGFSGHGMPRILLSTASLVPLILDDLNIKYTSPALVAPYPMLPTPFVITAERVEALLKVDSKAMFQESIRNVLLSAEKPFCNDERSTPNDGGAPRLRAADIKVDGSALTDLV